MKVKKIGIVSRCDKPEVIEMVVSIVDRFKDRVAIAVSPMTGNRLDVEGFDVVPVAEMRQSGVDLVISLGGDGTVLRNISKMEDPLPVLGINMGTLGFLVDVNPEEALGTIEKMLDGFSYVERARLSVFINGRKLQSATNEVVLLTARPAKILTFRIMVDDFVAEELRADGVIFATATGSTAYAMSAGGPIIDPRVDATLIVPLAPFKLSSRPIAVPGSSSIKVELVVPEKEAAIVIDGQYTYNIGKEDVVTLVREENPARFVKTSSSGFYEKVQSKLV